MDAIMKTIENRRTRRLVLLAASMALLVAGLAGPELLAIPPVRVIQFGDPSAEPSNPQRRTAVVTAVAMSPDGKQLAAGGDDHMVRLFDVSTGEMKHQLAGHHDWIRGLSLASDGETLASVANDHSCRLWQLSTGKSIEPAHQGKKRLRSVAFHPNGLQLATVGFHCPACIYNLSGGQLALEAACACHDSLSIAFSPDGARFAVAGRNGVLRIWDTASGRVLHNITADERCVRAIAFSPDSQRIATGGDGKEVRIWNVATGKRQFSLSSRPAKVFCLKFVNNQELAVGGTDNNIAIWRFAEPSIVRGASMVKLLVGHTGSVTSLAFDAQHKTLASGSYDTTIRIWNLEDEVAEKTANSSALPTR